MITQALNLAILARLFYRTKKDSGYINLNGCAFLVFFGLVLGPLFTALCSLIYILERLPE
jgi:hypothetical protein